MPSKSFEQKAWWRDGLEMLVAALVALLVSFPFSILMIFKPIFRALILYSSFNYLHWLGADGNKMWLFNLIVALDILFYYIGLFFPSWKNNPLRWLGSLLQVNSQSWLRLLPRFLMILHAAIIYSLLLNLAHHTIASITNASDWYVVISYWILFTVYTRFSFLPDDFDLIETLNKMPLKFILFNLLIFWIVVLEFCTTIFKQLIGVLLFFFSQYFKCPAYTYSIFIYQGNNVLTRGWIEGYLMKVLSSADECIIQAPEYFCTTSSMRCRENCAPSFPVDL
jgi:hypothetical protein